MDEVTWWWSVGWLVILQEQKLSYLGTTGSILHSHQLDAEVKVCSQILPLLDYNS